MHNPRIPHQFRALQIPGSNPDVFDHVPSRKSIPGGTGQHIILDQPFTRIGSWQWGDRLGWPIDNIANFCALDWISEDGTTPLIGPELVASGPGAITDSIATPWTRHDEIDVTCSLLDKKALASSLFTGPSLTDDIVLISMFRTVLFGGTLFPLSTWDIARGIIISAVPGFVKVSTYGNNTRTSSATYSDQTWCLIGFVIDRGGNQKLYVNGILKHQIVHATGSLDTSSISINNYAPIGTPLDSIDNLRSLVYFGDGIADITDDAWWRRLASVALGIHPVHPNITPSFSRSSASIYYVSNRIHLVGNDMPQAGSDDGRGPDDPISTLTYKNFNFISGDELIFDADAGLTVSVFSDTANLLSSGLREIGNNVIRVQNSSGVTKYIRHGSAVPNTNKHWPSARTRILSGGCDVGLHDGAAAWTKALDCADGYVRSVSDVIPANTSQKWALEIEDGSDILLTLPCLTESPVSPQEIINNATASTAAKAEGVITFPSEMSISDIEATIEVEERPEGWNSGDLGTSERIIEHDVTPSDHLVLDDTTQEIKCGDGVNEAAASIVETSNTWTTVRTSLGSLGLFAAQINGSQDSDTYDGAMGASGDIQLKKTGFRSIKNLLIYRNQRKRNT